MRNLHADTVHLPQEVATVLLMYGTETTKRGCIRFSSLAFSDLRGQILVMLQLQQLLKITISCCSIQNIQLALLHSHLAEMAASWRLHQVTHSRRDPNRKYLSSHFPQTDTLSGYNLCLFLWQTRTGCYLCSQRE